MKQHCRKCPHAYNLHYDAGHHHDHNYCKLNPHLLDTDGTFGGFNDWECIPLGALTYNKQIDVRKYFEDSGAM